MKVLVIGSGGREHALVWKIAQSPLVEKVYCAPGNPGIGLLAENVDLKVDDLPGLLAFAKKEGIDLTVVGPELPLSLGIVDLFEEYGLQDLRRRQNAAMIEASKAFSKDLMKKYDVPTAAYEVFTEVEPAVAFIDKTRRPDRYQGGRPGRRQGGRHRADEGRGGGGGYRYALRQRLRRCRFAGGNRGIPDR